MKELSLKVADDRLEKIAKTAPLLAIEELLWNGLDADATNIKVYFSLNRMKGIEKIIVKDNGHGIPYDQGEMAFSSLGGSIKKIKRKSPSGRLYHGSEGIGRYKAFRLGRKITWNSTFRDKDRKIRTFQIIGLAATRSHIVMSDIEDHNDGTTGVDVIIDEVDDTCMSLQEDMSSENLTLRLASYLMGYKNVTIEYGDQKIDPASKLAFEEEIRLSVKVDDSDVEGNLLICEWRGGKHKGLFLCNEAGIILDEVENHIHWDLSCTAYLKSNLFEELAAEDKLEIPQMFPKSKALIDAAQKSIQSYFKKRLESKAASLVAQLKKEKIYPYKEKPANVVEETERQVFDICAVKVYEGLPSFRSTDQKQKEFTLSLIKEALEAGPSALKKILQKILALSDTEKEDFAEILEYTSLPSLINIGQGIINRFQFLNGLEQIVGDRELKKFVKERSHLQHIIESELWIFGEAYSFCSPRGGDITLTNVLKAHLKLLGREDLVPSIDPNKLKDIPDLCLYQQYLYGREDEYENLVIELKRPGVLDEDHLTQIKRYATAVANDPLFDKTKTRWTFYIINTDFNDQVKEECDQPDRRYGNILNGKNYKIWVKRWSDIIQECKGRLEFARKQMDYSVKNNSEGIEYLRKKHAAYLPEENMNGIVANE